MYLDLHDIFKPHLCSKKELEVTPLAE